MEWDILGIDDEVEVNLHRRQDVKCAYSSNRLLPTEEDICLEQHKDYDIEKGDLCLGRCKQIIDSEVQMLHPS